MDNFLKELKDKGFSFVGDTLYLIGPDLVPDDIWKNMAIEFTKYGYDIRSASEAESIYSELCDNCKKYHKIGYPFTEDQKEAMMLILGLKQKEDHTAEYKKIAAKAARYYGCTCSFELAGYLTINGSLLDFSEGQRIRVIDHSQIRDILDLPDDAEYGDGTIEFMNEGNIRLGLQGFDVSVMPNTKQKSVLKKFVRYNLGEIYTQISGPTGSRICFISYKAGTSFNRIWNDLETYFSKGIIPEGTGNDFDAIA